MDFDQIKNEVKKIELDTVRADNEHYFEAVVRRASLAVLIGTLEAIFGPCTWPSRTKPSKDVEKLVSEFGGVRKGQSLYCVCKEGLLMIAMLWPWQDGESVTVKIARS